MGRERIVCIRHGLQRKLLLQTRRENNG